MLLATNKWRGTHHWIILGFFAISSSLFIALNGDVDMLGSVYNIAFLSVMVRAVELFLLTCGLTTFECVEGGRATTDFVIPSCQFNHIIAASPS